MAPPQKPFPVSELEERIKTYTTDDYKEKSRKLPLDFKLKDCELFELVQYSCTTNQQMVETGLDKPAQGSRMECFPFVRLFRRCHHKDKTFHVETTAWEGQHAWQLEPEPQSESQSEPQPQQDMRATKNQMFAEYGSYFWSKR